jgi:hypothetical protein
MLGWKSCINWLNVFSTRANDLGAEGSNSESISFMLAVCCHASRWKGIGWWRVKKDDSLTSANVSACAVQCTVSYILPLRWRCVVAGTWGTLLVELARGPSITLSSGFTPGSWPDSCMAALRSSSFFLLLGGTEDLEEE